jgi:hypothetical protein
MICMREQDSYQLFAHFLQKYHDGKNYYTGVVPIQMDLFEVLVSYQIFTEQPLYFELEFMVTENDVEVHREIDHRSFTERFGLVMYYFFFEKQYHEEYEGRETETVDREEFTLELHG